MNIKYRFKVSLKGLNYHIIGLVVMLNSKISIQRPSL